MLLGIAGEDAFTIGLDGQGPRAPQGKCLAERLLQFIQAHGAWAMAYGASGGDPALQTGGTDGIAHRMQIG